ncbi:hypothetical protein ACOCEA_15045 [Maribacter sp. CXY002]|uniref:hypothetical protein n=1 Tax=Maribacter luteocoastalis TaxID=3407671 RepID=UPI003B66EC34
MIKTYIPILAIFSCFILSSFTNNLECEYAESTIDFAKTHTEKAVEMDDINQARFYAYKALNVIEKSKKQLDICGCIYAKEELEEGLNNLILATKATTLEATQILLLRSLENTLGSLNALADHHIHNNKQNKDLASLRSTNIDTSEDFPNSTKHKSIYYTIDNALEKYKLSLDKVVETIECKEAQSFAEKIVAQCEKQLLRNDLTDGKKYYYLRTKEITVNALIRIGKCSFD